LLLIDQGIRRAKALYIIAPEMYASTSIVPRLSGVKIFEKERKKYLILLPQA
jgi:hypothetical protein